MLLPMIAFLILVCAIARVGYVAARSIWRRVDGDAAYMESTSAERIAAGTLAGLALWLAINWALALTHSFTHTTVFETSLAFVAVAVISLIPIRFAALARPRLSSVWIIVLIPIAVWSAYILWRGSLLPPDSHDALAYHLPKAVFLMQDHGYQWVPAPDPRITTFPANYEILIADLLLLSHGDRLTEWIGLAMFMLFLLYAAAVVERWWGRGVHVAIAVLVIAATPVLLLHSGADKNDLMTCVFAVGALLWGARWYARGGTMPWLLLIVALVCGAGTKPQQAAVLIGIAPFLIARFVRTRTISVRAIGGTIAISAVCFALCGGAPYVFDFIHGHGRMAPAEVNGLQNADTPMYGDWNNLWQFPYLLLAAPFSSDPLSVWVPWRHEKWYWPKYEFYFSNYGAIFTFAFIALPFCIWRYGREGDLAVRRERFAFSVAAGIAFFLILPVVFRPLGFFAGSGRYTAFVIPAVIAWSVAPAVRELEAAQHRLVVVLACGMSIAFAMIAADLAIHDRFSPLAYAEDAARQPHLRWIWFTPERAGTIVDRIAGPRDTIAVDGGFDTWLYPAMGATLTRRIEFIAPGPGPVQIPADAQWVMIDRSWHKLWGNPNFRDFGDFWQYIGKGRPTAQDTRVLLALLRDSRFELVYYDSRLNQAVFHRREAR